MGVSRTIGKQLGAALAPRVTDVAPGLTTSFVREALQRALDGAGPLPPARTTAERYRDDRDGDVGAAARALVDQHTRYAGGSGFLTNLGGLVTMPVAVPANLAGLALIQCRMVAGVAHLRGYDLTDPRTHNAVLTTLLGEEQVTRLVASRTLPAPPMALATAPVHDATIDATVSTAVARHLISRLTGRRLAASVGRRVPGLGGVVGGGADGWATFQVGRYAERELLPRKAR
ncbi:EcsC family protein [Nocardioides litoris]|uniref:EcsC family protein n=1 Tax=Nocardioides litoris TaxID=1926648 RepID=UPI001124C55C|nr:EcsC family protein [Nocardioides litoris]